MRWGPVLAARGMVTTPQDPALWAGVDDPQRSLDDRVIARNVHRLGGCGQDHGFCLRYSRS
jgi:hypothetical protein